MAKVLARIASGGRSSRLIESSSVRRSFFPVRTSLRASPDAGTTPAARKSILVEQARGGVA
ncbi:hypothetical protein IG631_07817 [Alternaria alternata]|nr:hypothetical protein IG631_07817 [Alternaria alternata]